MAISYVNTGSANISSGVTSLAAVLPASFVANDLLIMWLVWPDLITSPSLPSGWSQLGSLVTGANSKFAVYYKIAAGGDTAPTITWTTSSKPIFQTSAYRGVNTTTPFGANSIVADATSTTTVVGPTVTNTGTGVEWALGFYAFRTSNLADKAGSITAGSSGLTLRATSNGSGAASSPWEIVGTLDSNAVVTAASHQYTAGTSGIGTASGNKGAALIYLNPSAASVVKPPRPSIILQAITRSANW